MAQSSQSGIKRKMVKLCVPDDTRFGPRCKHAGLIFKKSWYFSLMRTGPESFH